MNEFEMEMDKVKEAHSEEVGKFRKKVSELESYVQESDEREGKLIESIRSLNARVRDITTRMMEREGRNELNATVSALLERQLTHANMLAKLIDVSKENLLMLKKHERFINELGMKERNES